MAKPTARAWVKEALARFHYLGFGGAVGENLQYVVRDAPGRPLACLVFGAAAWKCQAQDRYIGWTAGQRQQHLGWVAHKTRFLILPWVEVPDLGSWIPGQVAGRIAPDWQSKYGHPVVLLDHLRRAAALPGHGVSGGQSPGSRGGLSGAGAGPQFMAAGVALPPTLREKA
ncbi:MAG: Druantia anti-phage system protein DruA [Limisphaerales bacterium]